MAADLNYQLGALIDGFKIEPANNDVLTYSPVSITSAGGLAVVKNVLIDGFRVEGAPVVNVKGGMIYNALIRDNVTSAACRSGGGS